MDLWWTSLDLYLKPSIVFVWLSVILFGCRFDNQKPKPVGELPVIDLSKSHPKKEIHLQDIADIEYIPLETTDDVLLNQVAVLHYISNNYIVITNVDRRGNIFIFNRNGKIISYFNRQGQGGEEYIGITSVVFDEKNEEIFVLSNQNHRILVYSVSGEYKRTLKYSTDWMIWSAYNWDDETLLIYDEYFSNQKREVNEKPYVLLSKKDGSVVSALDIHLPVRYSNRIAIDLGNNMIAPASVPFTISNRHYGYQDYVIADLSSDTIYRLTKNRDLTPWLVHKPSVHTSDPRRVWSFLLTTDKFIVLETTVLDYIALEKNSSIPSKTLMYEFATGETSEITFVWDDMGMSYFFYLYDADMPKNMSARLMLASTILARYKANKLKGDAEKLAQTLDEEDNHVLVIIKFK